MRSEVFVNFLGYKEPNLMYLMRCKGVCRGGEAEHPEGEEANQIACAPTKVHQSDCLCPNQGTPRETERGGPCRPIATEVNRDSGSTNERDPSLIGSLGLTCRYKRFCSAWAAPVGPVQNIFFPIVHNINFSVPIIQQASPTVRQGHQSLYACLW
jgi:hypothetical protein